MAEPPVPKPNGDTIVARVENASNVAVGKQITQVNVTAEAASIARLVEEGRLERLRNALAGNGSVALTALEGMGAVSNLGPEASDEAAADAVLIDQLGEAIERHAEHFVALADSRERTMFAHSHNQLEAILRRAWRPLQIDKSDEVGDLAYPDDIALRRLNSLVFDCNNGYWDLAGLCAYRLIWLPRAVDACTQAGERRNAGAHLGNLGLAYADLGRVEEAIDHYQQALLISRKIGDRLGEGNHLAHIPHLKIRPFRITCPTWGEKSGDI